MRQFSLKKKKKKSPAGDEERGQSQLIGVTGPGGGPAGREAHLFPSVPSVDSPWQGHTGLAVEETPFNYVYYSLM